MPSPLWSPPWAAHKFLLWCLGHLIPLFIHYWCFSVWFFIFFPTYSSLWNFFWSPLCFPRGATSFINGLGCVPLSFCCGTGKVWQTLSICFSQRHFCSPLLPQVKQLLWISAFSYNYWNKINMPILLADQWKNGLCMCEWLHLRSLLWALPWNVKQGVAYLTETTVGS